MGLQVNTVKRWFQGGRIEDENIEAFASVVGLSRAEVATAYHERDLSALSRRSLLRLYAGRLGLTPEDAERIEGELLSPTSQAGGQ
jgi:hypothetical protein